MVMILQLIGWIKLQHHAAEVLKLVKCSCKSCASTRCSCRKDSLSYTDTCSCQVTDCSSNRVQCCKPFTTTVAAGDGYQEFDDDSASDSCDSDSDSQSRESSVDVDAANSEED